MVVIGNGFHYVAKPNTDKLNKKAMRMDDTLLLALGTADASSSWSSSSAYKKASQKRRNTKFTHTC